MHVKVFVHVCMHAGIQRPTLLFAPILLFSFKLGRPINVFVFGQCCFISSPYFSLFPLAQHEMWLLNRKSYKTNIPSRYHHKCSTLHSVLSVYLIAHFFQLDILHSCIGVRDGTIHIFNFRFDFQYLTHGSIYSRYFSQPRHLSHKIVNEQF